MNNLHKTIIIDEVINFINENDVDYQKSHTAPQHEDNSPMYDLTDIYGEDIYTNNALKYYGVYRNQMDYKTINVIQSAKNKPNKSIKIYRAVPNNLENPQINSGDWVTIHPQYAKIHGNLNLDNNYQIISKTVPASHLYTDGNSIYEWGYSPI